MSIQILNDWEDVVAINKPPGWLSIPGRGNKEYIPVVSKELGKILRGGQEQKTNAPDLYIVHRLDQGTSGAMLFARTATAHKELSQQFEKGEISKIYYALVKGNLSEKRLIDEPLFKLPSKKNKSIVDPKGKPSQTAIRSLGCYQGMTLIEAKPLTGRSHQIRVHLAHLGYPLIGDVLYGGPSEVLGKPCEFPLLHSSQISFDWPLGQNKIVSAPLLGFFAEIIDALGVTQEL